MAITRITSPAITSVSSTSISGTLPATNINDTSIGNITALPAGVGGKVLQMVSAATSSSTTISGTSFTSTSLTANITPSSSSNKIIIWCLGGEADTNGTGRHMSPSIFRDSTNIGNSSAGMNTIYGASSRLQGNPTVGVVDSPSSTSQLTYTLKIKGTSLGNVVFNANSCQATIILMEVTT